VLPDVLPPPPKNTPLMAAFASLVVVTLTITRPERFQTR